MSRALVAARVGARREGFSRSSREIAVFSCSREIAARLLVAAFYGVAKSAKPCKPASGDWNGPSPIVPV